MKSPVVILGATSGIGRAAVQVAVHAGQPVSAVSSDDAALQALLETHPDADLTAMSGSIDDEFSCAMLASRLRHLSRPIGGVVVAICGEPTGGRVIDQSSDKLRRTFQVELLPQLHAAKALIPLLAESGRNGSYVVIGGPGSEQPWSGYGHRSISAAATRMLLRVLHDEARSLSVRVHFLAVELPAQTDENIQRSCSHWPSAIAISERALGLVNQTDVYKPTEAVVRYPKLASQMDRRDRTPIKELPPLHSTNHMPSDHSPMAAVDDTWAKLKPLLSLSTKKGSTP